MGGNMGAKFGTYKYSINENITNYGRNLAIVDRQYRPKIKNKNGKPFTANEKYYKYKCLNCGNEDWILEYSLEGKQHCERPIIKSDRYRTTEEEHENDVNKYKMAKVHGIDLYFQIDCSKTDIEHMKTSIERSGILDVFGIKSEMVGWKSCDIFALSNLVKDVCCYKNEHPDSTLHDIAKLYKLSYKTVLQYIKAGNTYHWCSYALNDDRAILEPSGLINRGQKPIFCETNEMYYRDANVASSSLSNSNNFYYVRQIRKSISRNGTYKGLKFIFVSQEDFNNAKTLSPDKVVGDFFNITN